jgi:hypothetical protein
MSVVLVCLVMMAQSVMAQNLVRAPRAHTPHWPNITTFDYARLLYLNPPDATAYKWYTDRLDMVEVHGNGPTVRTYNPTSAETSYAFDTTAYTSQTIRRSRTTRFRQGITVGQEPLWVLRTSRGVP